MRYVVKLGGSLLTHKHIEDYPKEPSDVVRNPGKYIRLDVIDEIADIINQAKRRDKSLELVLVTGAGCCGHPQVKANLPANVISEIASMPAHYLNNALNSKGIETEVESPMRVAKCLESNGRHGTEYYLDDLWRSLLTKYFSATVKPEKLDYVAISYGDVVPMAEGKTGRLGDYEVVSGDDLITFFGAEWPADKVISVSDVDGVYAEFPPKEGQKPIARILANEPLRDDLHFKEKMEDLYKVKFNDVADVTGGLLAKVIKLYKSTHRTKIPSQLIGLNKLKDVLSGHYAVTLIERTA